MIFKSRSGDASIGQNLEFLTHRVGLVAVDKECPASASNCTAVPIPVRLQTLLRCVSDVASKKVSQVNWLVSFNLLASMATDQQVTCVVKDHTFDLVEDAIHRALLVHCDK